MDKGAWFLTLAAVALFGACSDGSTKAAASSADGGNEISATQDILGDAASDTAAALPQTATAWAATPAGTVPVSMWYSQGIAKIEGGWVFSHAGGLFRTDDAFVEQLKHPLPLPAALTELNFIHIGDLDAWGDTIWAGLEQTDYSKNQQAVAWFDAKTLTVQGYQLLAQHQCSWLSVDPAAALAYTMDQFSDDTVLIYNAKTPGQWQLKTTLKMDRKVDKVQGGDVALGALWLSTDDAEHGLYRVDLASGATVRLGSLGHLNGKGLAIPEGEGIDATLLNGALLHTLTGEPLKITSWVDHFVVTAPGEKLPVH